MLHACRVIWDVIRNPEDNFRVAYDQPARRLSEAEARIAKQPIDCTAGQGSICTAQLGVAVRVLGRSPAGARQGGRCALALRATKP